MSLTLLKLTWKQNWKLLLIFFAVLTMYITVMVGIFNPDDMEDIESMLNLFPKDLMNAMGFSQAVTDLTGYLASWLYGLLMFGFPMVYCIILGNKLVARMVDNGSFSYLLSTPKSRTTIVVTQGFFALASLALLFIALWAVGYLFSEARLPGLLDLKAFTRLNVTTMLVNMTVIMIAFFASCVFNETKYSLAFGAGLPIAFLLLNMIGGTSSDAEILKKFSIYGWYDPVEIVRDSQVLGLDLIYIGIILVLFVGGVLIFRRKQLPI